MNWELTMFKKRSSKHNASRLSRNVMIGGNFFKLIKNRSVQASSKINLSAKIKYEYYESKSYGLLS